MSNKKKEVNEKIKVELGGMEIYGTTGNIEVQGYKMTGDIENAGHMERGFEKTNPKDGARSSIVDTMTNN